MRRKEVEMNVGSMNASFERNALHYYSLNYLAKDNMVNLVEVGHEYVIDGLCCH